MSALHYNSSINADGRVTVAMQAHQARFTHKKRCVSPYNIPHQTRVHQPTIPECYHKFCAHKRKQYCVLTTQSIPQFSYCVLFYAP
jgi:hypothetical protein